jgi:hypothetical protein
MGFLGAIFAADVLSGVTPRSPSAPRPKPAPRPTTCAGCGAPLSLTGCTYCRRRRDDDEDDQRRRREADAVAGAITNWIYESPASSPAPSDSFSSGGGGDFAGGGATGDW